MKRFLSFFLVISLVGPGVVFAQAKVAPQESPEVSGAELLFAEIPMVITASKISQRIDKAPSIMTVITSEDIKRSGARSLEEVLRRVVGFNPTRSNDWEMIGSRGVSGDMNNMYLFLINGHSINSINGWGPQNQHIFPLLSYVDRIEIIRGPGSTMWGSDAVMGTINIITKKGSDVKGVQASYDYSENDNQYNTNIMLGGELSDKTNYLASLTYTQSQGYHTPGEPLNYQHYATNYVNSTTNQSPLGHWENWGPTYDFYSQVNAGPFTFQGKKLHFIYYEPSNNRPATSPALYTNRYYDNSFMEAGYLKAIDDTTSFETKLFTDSIYKGRYPTVGTSADQDYKETGGGVDMILRKTFMDIHHVQLGVRGTVTDIGNNTNISYVAGTDTASGVTNGTTYYLLTASGRDRAYGAYLEDQYDVTKTLSLVLGGRVDTDDLRENSTKILPRFSIMDALTDDFSVKYALNSGYYRPAINQAQRLPSANTTTIRDAHQSLDTMSHDLQFNYDTKATKANLTFYYQILNHYIINVPNRYRDGSVAPPGGYANIGNVKTEGVELEAHQKIIDTFSVYGNWSYSLARLVYCDPAVEALIRPIFTGDHQRLLAFPHQLYNLGVDWGFMKKANLNLHVRGWRNEETQLSTADNIKFKGQAYLDTNLLFENIAGLPLSISIYCFNLFDKKAKETETMGSYSFDYAEGRNIGSKITYKF